MATDWKMIWSFALAKERNVSARPPVISDEQITCVFHYDKKSFFESSVIGFAKSDGRELWRHSIDHVATDPLIDPHTGAIYVASFAGAIHAYALDGSVLWTSAFGNRNVTPPVLAGDRLFIAETGGGGKTTWCLDKSTGNVLWSYENGGHSYRLLCHDGKLFQAVVISGPKFGDSTIHLICLDQQTGKLLWSSKVDEYHFNAVVVDGLLVWGARNALNAYDPANGTLKASLPLPERAAITSGPVMAGNQMICCDDNNVLRAVVIQQKGLLFKKPDLQEIWSHPLDSAIVGSPHVFDGQIYLLGEQGQVYALAFDSTPVSSSLGLTDGKGKAGGMASDGSSLALSTGRSLMFYQR